MLEQGETQKYWFDNLFRITVHATTERALVDDFGFDVQPSMTTSVGLEEVAILKNYFLLGEQYPPASTLHLSLYPKLGRDKLHLICSNLPHPLAIHTRGGAS